MPLNKKKQPTKIICIYKNLSITAYFFKRREDFSFLLKNPTFLNIIPRAKHVLNTFKLRTLYARSYIFRYIHFICFYDLDSIHRCVNNSHDIKVLMKVIKTESFNVDFTSQ